MKSAIFTTSALTALAARQAYAQNTPLNTETNQVCGMTLRTNNNAVLRTNDWNLAVNNGDSALSQAPLWITGPTPGFMYGSNGQRCGFDPYLECDDDDTDNDNNNQQSDRDNGPFAISTDGTLSFHNSTTFYLCRRNAFTDFDDDGSVDGTNDDDLQDYPYIYPANGTTDDSRNFQNCTETTIVADRCFAGSNEYTVAAGVAATSTAALPSNTATGTTLPTGTQASNTGSGTGTGTTSATQSATSTVSANSAGRLGGSSVVMTSLMLAAAGVFAWL